MPLRFRHRPRRRERLLAFSLIVILALLDLLAALITRETLGEVSSALAFVLVLLNLPILVLAWRFPSTSAVAALGLASLLVPRQTLLAHRLHGLEQEAAAIVGFVYEKHRSSGEFPATLDGYRPMQPELMSFLTYERSPETGGFGLWFWVGTPTTSHWYMPRSGWGYYPD